MAKGTKQGPQRAAKGAKSAKTASAAAKTKTPSVKLQKGVYMNREFSWLKFDTRVLQKSMDESIPLLERGKFLSIFCSNMDEFFMVRMGSLYNDDKVNPRVKEDKTGLTAGQQLLGMSKRIAKTYETREYAFTKLKCDLAENGINILTYSQLSPTRKAELHSYFKSKVLPLLSPMVVDAKHPLFSFENLKCYMLYRLKKNSDTMIGVMQFPDRLDEVYRFSTGKHPSFITLEEIMMNMGHLAFPGYDVTSSIAIRTTRNADYDADFEDADMEYNNDFSKYMKRKVETRLLQNVIRLEVKGESKSLLKFVNEIAEVPENLTYTVDGNLTYSYLSKIPRMLERDVAKKYSYPPFKPQISDRVAHATSLVDEVREKDILLRYPYDSMDTLIRLLDECAERKDCIAIKITIYRLAEHSRIVEALKRASEHDIDVTVVIELTARFDEENNMYFANILQEAGCNIIYGMQNYKVHSKILSIVFSDESGISYITHLGTGNYNESSAKQYTDLNIITADKEIGEDGAEFFRNVSISNVEGNYSKLLIAPKYLKPRIMSLLDREIEKAKNGGEGVFVGKMNSLTDKEIIDKICEASQAGVKVRLIVRGICCLLPGKPGKTENVRIISIVGRFLEHSRIYCFGSGDDRVMYISSADLMTRNTKRRVEIATPVLDKDIEAEIYGMLRTMLQDNVNAMELLPSGKYVEIESADRPVDSQAEYLVEE